LDEHKSPWSPPHLPSKIPALDGLRGLSILLVVFAHAVTTNGMPSFMDKAYFASLGNIGVRIFFVISGFLITTLLMREYATKGAISLKSFYIRRAFRILPAVFAYLGIISLAYALGLIELRFHMASRTLQESAIPDLVHAFTFTYNYVPDYVWYLNHLWSLSVEEQFYFLWPVTLVFFGIKRAAHVGLALLIITPFIRWAMLAIFHSPIIALSREFQAVMDALLIGCVAAAYFNRLMANSFFKKSIDSLGGFVGPALIILGYLSAFYSKEVAAVLGQTIANFGACVLILHVLSNQNSLLGAVFRTRGLIFFGLISYSLYLWQQPFLFFLPKDVATSFPQNLIFSVLAALISYFLIEKPAIALRHKLKL
jgi:peptidoglycan/LPS O-acetylase OafA/YrhL